MAIVQLSKLTCYGPIDRKGVVLEELQTLGCLHLLNLRADEERRPGGAGVFVEAHEALKYLDACPIQRRATKEEDFNLDEVTADVLDIRDREVRLHDERDLLKQELARQRPWGEFRLPPPDAVRGLRFWFYIIPHYRMRDVRGLDHAWQVVARDNRFDYVVVISADEPQGMPAPWVDLDPRPLTELMQRLDEVEDELEELHWRRVSLTRWRHRLEQELATAANRQRLEEASWKTWDADRVFALRGWAPTDAIPQMKEFAAREALALTVEEPQPDELPPTLLRNPELLAGGEEAVKFYMTPGYRMWDPSLVVFFSFSVFFAMILADAGYGLLLAVTVLLLWKRLEDTKGKRRVRKLGLALSIASVIYGVIAGTYLGLKPAEGTLLARLHLLDSREMDVMMPLAVLVGAAHVGLGIAMTGWRLRHSLQVLSSWGWGIMLVGGLFAGFAMTGYLFERAVSIGVGVIALGGVLVLCFSSPRPWPPRGFKDGFGRFFDGLKALTAVTSAFGDVLSYLRIFALGLASTILAETFNSLARDAADQPALGVLLGALVFVIGHAFNFVLAGLSGVVHGLRLNCIEFFKWSIAEEGYPFEPFSRKPEVE